MFKVKGPQSLIKCHFPRLGYIFGFFTVLNASYEGSQLSRYCINLFLFYCVCRAWLQQYVLLLLQMSVNRWQVITLLVKVVFHLLNKVS